MTADDRALIAGAALLDLGAREGVLEVRGRDAADYLQRRLSADVRRATHRGDGGRGLPATLLGAKGKLIAPLRLFRLPPGASGGPGAAASGAGAAERFMLLAERPALAPLAESLARLVILEEVEIEERPLTLLSVQGPAADRVLHGESAGGEPLPAEPHAWVSLDVGAALPGLVIRAARSLAGGFDLLVPAERQAALRSRLAAEGALAVGEEAIERHRIAAGIPRFGVDATAENLPTECGYDDAVAYDKGCYAGQEVLARIRTYGHVNRRLCRLHLAAGAPPIAGAELRLVDDSAAAATPGEAGEPGEPGGAGGSSGAGAVGRVTSAARDPAGAGAIALATVRHRHARLGVTFQVDGAGRGVIDLVIGDPPAAP